MPDEFEIIEDLFAPLAGPEGLGLKDDAAVMQPRAGYDLVITKDAIAAGRHYLPGDPPDTIAKKLLRVNLSDLATKGAKPLGYLLSCAWSETTDLEWMRAFAAGLAEDQRLYDVRLWGGDTIKVAGPSVFSLTAIGEVPQGQMITRTGAQAGDDLWVTGTVGDAALGLKVAQGKYEASAERERDYLISRYQVPEPPVAFGRELHGIATTAVDVSDGLLGDLAHVCQQSGVGAVIERQRIPLSAAMEQHLVSDTAGWQLVFGGGDDYQILFAAPSDCRQQIMDLAAAQNVQVFRIGSVTQEKRMAVLDEVGQPIDAAPAGFTHF